VQGQLEAYNAGDVERFAQFYAPDVRIEDGEGKVLLEGREALRARYGPIFAAHPQLHCRLASRIRIGAWVVDEERITGRGPGEQHAVAIYRVKDGLITHVRFLRP
jgi:hypothetical protein